MLRYGGDFPLTVVENDIPNFYLNTDYYDNGQTQDQIEIEVTVNNSDYLVETNDAAALRLSNLGLGIMSLAKLILFMVETNSLSPTLSLLLSQW